MIFKIRTYCAMPLDLLKNWNGKKRDDGGSSRFSLFLSFFFLKNSLSVSFLMDPIIIQQSCDGTD